MAAGDPSPTEDNGALVSLEYFLTLDTNERRVDILRLKSVLRNLEVKTENGVVTTRFPGCWRTDSMDNATALIIFSELFDDSRLSKDLYRHGELTYAKRIDPQQDENKSLKYYPIAWLVNRGNVPRRFWNVRPNDWSIQSWWGRSPGFLGLLELSALDRTSMFRTISLLVGQFLPLFEKKQETSGKKLTYIVWQWLKTRSKFWSIWYKIWCMILLKVHPNGMKDVYEIYYGPNHPLTLHTPNYLK